MYVVMTYVNILDPGLSEGVLCNHPCRSVCLSVRPSVRPSVFEYLRDRSLVFSQTLHEVRGHQSKESDTAGIFENKSMNFGVNKVKKVTRPEL